MSPHVALITPSYRGDLERCRLLCEGTTRFLPAGCEHILLVDRRDVPLFRPLANSVVRIVEAESLLPWWIFRPPFTTRLWASLATIPIRNWILQQILKIGSVQATDAEVLQFVDSDVALIRPVPVGDLVRGNLVRLQRVSYHDPEHDRWLQTAARLLGVAGPIAKGRAYVGNYITWRRSVALKMTERIEKVTGTSWIRAVGNCASFSEYTLYGVFAEDVLGLEAAGLFHSDAPTLQLSWEYDLRTEEGMNRFFAEIKPEHFGVMIHSKDGVPLESYRRRVEELWSRTRV